MNNEKPEENFIPCGDAMEKMGEICDDDLENVSGGAGIILRPFSGLAEEEANTQNNMVGGAASGMTCPKCGFRMKLTVPIQGIVSSGPDFVCPTCVYAQ